MTRLVIRRGHLLPLFAAPESPSPTVTFKERLNGLLDELRDRAQPVVEATNRIIAHNDAVTIQRNERLGVMPGDAYERLVADMYEWIKLAGVEAPYGTAATLGGHPVEMDLGTLRAHHWESYWEDGETQAAALRRLLLEAAHG